MSENRYLAARSVLDGVLAREPTGATLEAARRFADVLDLDPNCLPAIQALQHAVESGADVEANAILERLLLRQPRGRFLSILMAYRRILDGRAVVAGLVLRLESRPETGPSKDPAEKLPPGVPKDARFAHLFLVVESRLAGAVELDPGPATLFVTRSSVGRAGREEDAVETHTFPSLKPLHVEWGKPAEVSLARFFLAQPGTNVATRLRFEIDLRSGRARIAAASAGGPPRDVPAMRLRTAEAEETVLEASLAALSAATPEELAGLVEHATSVDLVSALSIAARIPPKDRARTLDLLTPIAETAPASVLQALVPALRWIAVTAEPGGDGLAWRAWLRARADTATSKRQKLVLPPALPTEPDP